MSTFDVDRKNITTFEVEDIYLFKQYSDQYDVFDTLKTYCNRYDYRVEILDKDVDKVRQILDEFFYHLQVEDDLDAYCVVKQKGSNYSDILKNSVLTKRRNGYIVFLMEDRVLVEQAIEYGTKPLEETDIHLEL